jgi:crotonobetaine/carnitine-CoA ligase
MRQRGKAVQGQALGDWLRAQAKADPNRPFVQCGGGWLNLGDLDRRSDAVAAGLQQLGAAVGDRIAVILPNCIEYIVLIYAIAKTGAVQVPINPYLRGEFLRHQLSESGASIAACDRDAWRQVLPMNRHLPALGTVVLVGEQSLGSPRESQPAIVPYTRLESSAATLRAPALSANDLCVIMYTSGTTGASKGCMISHGYYRAIPATFIEYGWFQPGDIIFGASPLFHFTGQVTLVAMALAVGGAAVVEPAFSATTFMARAREVRATVVFGVGSMAMAILAQPTDTARERDHQIRQSVWIPLSESDQRRFEQRFGISVVSQVYGQSECWPATLARVDDPSRKPASLGRTVDYLELRLVDDEDHDVPVGTVGEVVIRPRVPNRMFGGYWNNPAATVASFRNLWHHTGDNGRFDEDGLLYFVDRKKDALRRRGENVSSIELEQAIMKHPAIARAAVHAVPSELTEDDIKVCVLLVSGAVLPIEDLFDFFKKELPYYAVPRYVEYLEELPMSATLRVQKHRLRERGITPETCDLVALGLVVNKSERRL